MKRRQEPEQLDPVAVAAATPDEPFDAAHMLVLDRTPCGSCQKLADLRPRARVHGRYSGRSEFAETRGYGEATANSRHSPGTPLSA